MSKPSTVSNLLALLPWYTNHTLSVAERESVEAWLESQPEAASPALRSIESLQAVVSRQPQLSPSPAVRQQLLARIQIGQPPRRQTPFAWLISSVVALAFLVALWAIVQPGIALHWSVDGGQANAYRIYRALTEGQDFHLLSEVPAQANLQSYSFIDITSLPGQTYTYVVEAVTQGGQTSRSPLARAQGWDVVPAQLALILASVMVGLATLSLATGSTWTMANRRPIGA